MSKVEITQRRLAATARGVGIMCDFYIDKAKMPNFGTLKATVTSISRAVLVC